MLYWLLKTVVLGPVLKVLFRPWVEGEEHIPDAGGVIFASNHLSFSDSIFLPLVVPRKMTFLAKADYFTGTGLKGRLTKMFFTGVGQLPVDRSGGRASSAALDAGLKVLRAGDILGLYPEGTRSPDGRLYKGKTGVARMALAAQVPIVPVAMQNTTVIKKFGLPWIDHPVVVIGEPLDFSEYFDRGEDPRVLRWVTDEVMAAIQRLSGQTYVEAYGTSVKSGSLTKAQADARILERPGINTKQPDA